ncbi:CTP synthetase [Natrarchaeobius halalkaliphilus]|uniref:CTP synthetase n=1 Tax=Natrarchaeobius halalkaliphilus TaxID=1679091 RepID=A0A3N6MTS9_9EURY|nr:CTP synthetase [Natrarchaeobius halalkaliphilus]RQG88782.1 CTP synthetase [Natrarchaeobius halalkaliphilus]
MSRKVIVAGPDDDDIAPALENEGADVHRLDGVLTRPRLEEVGIVGAELYVLTDIDQATSIPIVCDLSDQIRTVVYSRKTIPEFVRGQLDLSVDPRLVDPAVVADELVD